MTRMIEVVPYRNEWPSFFEKEAKLIKEALGNNCLALHHIGSTAVPGLAAKPVIDILPVVKNILKVDKVNSAMEQLGYEVKGEFGIPFRRFFQKGGEKRTHHVHIFEKDNPEIERHIKFRDWMIEHADDKEQYGKLKQALALKFPHDIMSYCMGKDDFIASIDAKTGFNGLRMVRALTDREWQAVRKFRQNYFFNQMPLSNTDEHIHFILYQGSKIIGYAHLQYLPNKRSELKMIAIDKLYQHNNIESDFLKKCERWLKEQDFIMVTH